jgi:ribosomal protein L11 methyltransferase
VFYPALDVAGVDGELLLAVVDDYSPTAVEDRGGLQTVFFSTASDRDRAAEALAAAFPAAHAARRDVDDEDWARRSQQSLQPVTVGRITVAPPWSVDRRSNLVLIVEPSMGFGTGHHATTRLCLAALQAIDLTGARVLDVGTGSGVLAMAACLLGARKAVGIDTDNDAIRSANENLELNPDVRGVTFECADLRVTLAGGRPAADVLTANLTGALLIRSAGLLIDSVEIGGHLILSGLMQAEQPAVGAAFAERTVPVRVTSEEEWVGLLLRRTR